MQQNNKLPCARAVLDDVQINPICRDLLMFHDGYFLSRARDCPALSNGIDAHGRNAGMNLVNCDYSPP
jgi:hypothetical protein